MAQLIQPIQSQEYYEKAAYHEELPPTPSSSAFSFLVSDQKEFENASIEEKKMPLNTTMRTTSYYGSINSESINFSGQASSSSSTISPNDDDEGLYLLWTHQLLREKGFNPSSCRLDDDNDDNESVDSSITDLSHNDAVTSSQNSPSFFKLLFRKQQNDSRSSSWFSCFPMC